MTLTVRFSSKTATDSQSHGEPISQRNSEAANFTKSHALSDKEGSHELSHFPYAEHPNDEESPALPQATCDKSQCRCRIRPGARLKRQCRQPEVHRDRGWSWKWMEYPYHPFQPRRSHPIPESWRISQPITRGASYLSGPTCTTAA
jgi:hypothetical protein